MLFRFVLFFLPRFVPRTCTFGHILCQTEIHNHPCWNIFARTFSFTIDQLDPPEAGTILAVMVEDHRVTTVPAEPRRCPAAFDGRNPLLCRSAFSVRVPVLPHRPCH